MARRGARPPTSANPTLPGGPGGEKTWKGELSLPEPVIAKAVKAVHDMGVPLTLRANGDGAIEAFFQAHEKAAAGDPGKLRNVRHDPLAFRAQ
jgi:predicted amidohydrolase YtcJ